MSWRRKKIKPPYKSGLEEGIADDLTRRGVVFQYELRSLGYRRRVPSGICDACGHRKVSQEKKYLPDFFIETPKIIVESKGRFTGKDRAKMLAVKEAYPELDIRFVFPSNNKLNKNKDARYSDWATEHNFPYHIGKSIPTDWCEGAAVGVRGRKPRKHRQRNNGEGKRGKGQVGPATDAPDEGSS